MDNKLEKGEIICPLCNGKGHIGQNIYVCEKCNGNGKVDWVSNIITKKKKRSSLDIINTRRIIAKVNSMVDSLKYEPNNKTTIHKLNKMIDHFLLTAKSNKAIYDYKVDYFHRKRRLEISIKPNISIETIKMDIDILNK